MNEVQINKIKKRADEYATSCFPYEKQFLERETVVKCCVHVVTETIADLEKENAELENENALFKGRNEGFEKQIMGLLIKYEEFYKRFPDLKSAMDKAEEVLKENAELKADNDARKFAMAMSEKVEKQLREENTKLKDVIEGYKKIAKWCDNCDKIAELKSENQKWKDEWQEQVQKATDEGYARTLQTMQLTKAKELLKKWVQTSKASGCDNINIVTDTEQFISEVEK